ncbi:reverse transcriptase/maturase family protein [Photobacterium sp. TLY01]|uniref:reverse transcriptase/maturase family protein n=1 Tax=Photobacterium sp. TLY01 TaxID=2907534 RepID=UPI001F42C42B|nr:reverse transcriptase/maturase family protein [Photobacterium sp. TLY01]UIP27779.1 reverse transcriptase/maturase family protein [Photobacterium sp. TLY01]
MPTVTELIKPEKVEAAFQWLKQQRKHFPPNSDIWTLLFHWETEKHRLIQEVLGDTFYFQPLQAVTKANGERLHLWSSRDSLVLKLLAYYLEEVLPKAKCCTHLKSHGGAKATVNQVFHAARHSRFVYRTDVKSFYDSIDHETLLMMLERYVQNKTVLNLLTQYLKRTVESGGNFKSYHKGISSGCPLSPLMGGLYLYELDRAMSTKAVFYRRYMDDIIILVQSRWQLRRAVRCVNTFFERLKLKAHPDQTCIGRIDKGFDFLGYQYIDGKVTVSERALSHHLCRYARLFEQKHNHPNRAALLDAYRQRWLTWVCAGIEQTVVLIVPLNGRGVDENAPITSPLMPA